MQGGGGGGGAHHPRTAHCTHAIVGNPSRTPPYTRASLLQTSRLVSFSGHIRLMIASGMKL